MQAQKFCAGVTDTTFVAPTGLTPGKVVLARDLSQFLVDFSVALHRYGMYPPGHPALVPITARLTESAERLLEDRPALAFGVAQRQLIIDGVATDPNQPVLRRLAEELHTHHLGAISLLRGVNVDELGSALRALSEETDADSAPLGLAPRGELPDWPHVRLHPLAFDRLELLEEHPAAAEGARGGGEGRASHLWIGLASAAMASEAGARVETTEAEPADVAKAIDEHGAAAYDQVIVGHLLQIADELKRAQGSDLKGLRDRTARLISALQPETLQRLMAMGGNVSQRHAFVQGVVSGMAVDSVLKILKAAADASGRVVSDGLARMLSKLAIHAESGDPHIRPIADNALREQVDRLLSGWKLADPNPDGYTKVLHHLATAAPDERAAKARVGCEDAEGALRLVQMSLETGASGPLVDRAMARAIATDARSVCQLLKSMPDGCDAAADALKSKFGDSRVVEALVSREPLDAETLDEMIPFLSIAGYTVLIDALGTSNNRTTRRKLLDRLAQANLDIAPLVAARLDDERWYVQRNMLVLLQRLQRVPAGFSARRWTRHPDLRVRHQAIRLQLTMPAEREAALAAALEDGDERITREGLVAFQDECPRPLVPLVARVALSSRVIEELRVKAVRVLAASRDQIALEALLQIVDGGKSVLGKPRLAPRTPAVHAALRALSVAWSSNARAAEMLALSGGSAAADARPAARPVRA